MKNRLLVILILTVVLAGCSIFEQASEMSRISRCEFRVFSVKDIDLAGIDIDNKDSFNDFSIFDIATISTVIATGKLPLSFVVNLQIRNPNPQKAALNKMEWILLIDGNEMLNGVLNQRYEIAGGGGMTTIPVNASIDLLSALGGKNLESLANFGLNLAGTGSKPTRITMKIKPSIIINSKSIDYPGYITINSEYSSGQGFK